jgi:hypothetical protein
MKREEIEKLARKRVEQLHKQFNDPRYKKVIGKFVATGLLEHNKVKPYLGNINLEDTLWVGGVEPRILELLPAVLLRRPKLIEIQADIPEDLRLVLVDLRKGIATNDFRGIPATAYQPWVERVGRKAAPPSVLKSFRFQSEDVARLNEIKTRTGLNETEIIRKALQLL